LRAILSSQKGSIMRTQFGSMGVSLGIVAVVVVCESGASTASADDSRLTVRPAVQTVDDAHEQRANVQLVQWRGLYGYRYGGYYGPVYGGAYYSPYYVRRGFPYPTPYGTPYPTPYATPYPTPYGTPYYGYRTYAYGYPFPAYGYGYPAWGYPAYGGIGIRTGPVGFGIW
jgi:hypothetical protein